MQIEGATGSTREATDAPRDRVFAAVLEHGPVSAASLAGRLGVTPAAVRRHLEALSDDGLIEPRSAPTTGRRGRPARVFVATERGQGAARGDYDDLAVAALEYLDEHVGDGAVRDFAERRFGELERRYAPVVDAAGPDPRERAKALARQLSTDGFAASARTVAVSPLAVTTSGTPVGGVQLCQGHCPVHAVATRFPQLCEAETRVFSRLLGVHVQRLATIAHGEHVCTTFVPTPDVPLRNTSAPPRLAADEPVEARPAGARPLIASPHVPSPTPTSTTVRKDLP
ncbi:helix-turn-helix transcriptional regulator [Aquipuribacter sp. MA13-6]|uniref:helix-turn-helix transcriptional regulator n=1 Tax=unclassified Aquipuribacter TaxID=2635084 RepID=UPI003EE9547A